MKTTAPSLCPECGNPVAAESQHQVCPACLLRQALASRTILSGGTSDAPVPPPAPGEIADKFPQFEISECLGRGGMGVVYKARQKSLDRWVAIKILPPERVGEEKFAERFAREAQMLARLNHPNIVTVFDYGETDGLFYIVMEFIDGVNLRDLLRDGKLEPKQALAIVPPICEALQFAHDKGIVHRDIKPENLLLDRDGRIKIADFGIASLVGAVGERSGTPPYMAPEQSGSSLSVDHRADIYALGVVLYEMLTGERPAKDFVAPSKKVQIDVRIDEMVLRALEKAPERRYQTAGEFQTVLQTVSEAIRSEGVPPAVSAASAGNLPTQIGEVENPSGSEFSDEKTQESMVAGGQESLAQSPGKSSVGKAILIGCGLLMLVGCATLVLLVGSLFFLRTSVRQNAMAEETWLEAKNSLESIEFNGKNAPASQGEKAAVAAAETWLALVDKGDYEQTWKDASPFFRASVTEEIWKSAMERFRKPLGKLNSRKLKFAQSVKSLPGAPDGEYVVMQFDTSLASKNSAVETVTFTHESDGQWRALGYFIK